MPSKRRFKDKYAGSSPENASVVRTCFPQKNVIFSFFLGTYRRTDEKTDQPMDEEARSDNNQSVIDGATRNFAGQRQVAPVNITRRQITLSGAGNPAKCGHSFSATKVFK